MTAQRNRPPEDGLRKAIDIEIVQNLLEVAELRSEMHASLQALSKKINRLLGLQEKVERNSQAIARLKTIWSFVAAGIARVVAALRDWLFGSKRATAIDQTLAITGGDEAQRNSRLSAWHCSAELSIDSPVGSLASSLNPFS